MDTERIMQIALDMAGLDHVPADSGIHVPGRDVKKVLFGIDIETAELLLARQLDYDLVIAHHPPGGTTRTQFDKVVERQIQQMIEAGVPPHIAEKAIRPRLESVRLNAHVSNYDRVVSAAKLLNMPLMNVHLPLDIICRKRFIEAIEKAVSSVKEPRVKDAVAAMKELPELKMGLTAPIVALGSADNLLGRWVVAMAGGTNGGAGVAKAYFDAGVSTVIYMHIGESDLKELQSYSGSGNLIATGHMSSDSVGISPFVKRLRAEGLEVTPMSGVFVPD
ncbi:MAG: Nif3-like dinuclear metal center hexameric protein [Candidatus Thorarchaeota archaeon]|nr:Nif3-like dinuclear metal center hexameric protein [Candidatus Thorarchaeota archaeon]